MRKPSAAKLNTLRRDYARRMLAEVGVKDDARLERAFAAIPREAFLGRPPWLTSGGAGYGDADGDLARIYQDVLIALKPEKQINNGSPSLHAQWMHEADVKPGENVAHIGAGAGYYTAILATLAAPGAVTAVEYDEDLSQAARAHLSPYRNVTVVHSDGAGWPHEPCDVVYVNFAVDRPAAPWLEKLKPGGRLLFPLGSIGRNRRNYGAALRVERTARQGAFAARFLGPAFFVRAQGEGPIAQGDEREALLAAFERGGGERVRSLRWQTPPAPDAWFVGDGWSLGLDVP